VSFRLSHDTRVLLLALAGGLPGVVACVVLLAIGGFQPRVQVVVDAFAIICWLGFCFAARGRVSGPLRTPSAAVSAIRVSPWGR
jgi:hypothetical protein